MWQCHVLSLGSRCRHVYAVLRHHDIRHEVMTTASQAIAVSVFVSLCVYSRKTCVLCSCFVSLEFLAHSSFQIFPKVIILWLNPALPWTASACVCWVELQRLAVGIKVNTSWVYGFTFSLNSWVWPVYAICSCVCNTNCKPTVTVPEKFLMASAKLSDFWELPTVNACRNLFRSPPPTVLHCWDE